jgi:hypothetical protein
MKTNELACFRDDLLKINELVAKSDAGEFMQSGFYREFRAGNRQFHE